MAVGIAEIAINTANLSDNPWTKVNSENGDYIGEDGLWWCGLCKTRKQVKYRNAHDRQIFGAIPPMCMCACMTEKARRGAKLEKHYEAKREAAEARIRGFADTGRQQQTFAVAEDSELIQTAKRYVENWGYNKSRSGLYFYGGTGVGKTFAVSCIANAVIDKGYTALVTSLPRLIDKMIRGEAAGTLDRVAKVDLLVLDDFGTERHTEMTAEKIFQIIDTRISNKKPMLITSNFSISKLENGDADISVKRIASRVRGNCIPIFCGGEDRRKPDAAEI